MNISKVCISFFVMFGLAIGSVHAAEKVNIENGTYQIQNINSQKSLEVRGYNYGVADLTQRSFQGDNNQIFQFEALADGSYRIRATHSGLYFDVYGMSKENGAAIIEYPWHGGDNQRFYIEQRADGKFQIRSKFSGKMIDVYGMSINDGAKVHQWEENNTAAQVFTLQPVEKNVNNHPNYGLLEDGYYLVVNKNSRKVLDVPAFSPSNGIGITQYNRNSGNNQIFYFRHVGNDSYTITAAHSGKALDIEGVSKTSGARLIQWDSNPNADNQKFYVEPYGDQIMFRAKHSNLMIDIYGMSMADGARVQQWSQNFSDAQMFSMVKINKQQPPPAPVQTGFAGIVANSKTAQKTNQILTVVASGTTAQVIFWEKSGGLWNEIYKVSGFVGSQGVGLASEYVSRTPKGSYSLGFAFGTGANPGTTLPYQQITQNSWWVSDVNSSLYNTWQESAQGFKNSEHLADYPTQYKYAVVIDYNVDRVKGAGSGFFLHCSNGKATAGCVAIPQAQMLQTLQRLKSGAYIINVTSEQEVANY